LLGDNAVADRDAMLFGSVRAERDNVAGVLVSGYTRTLDGTADAVLSQNNSPPVKHFISEAQMPQASTSINTSPTPGFGTGTSSTR
jgi:hypothetical protein